MQRAILSLMSEKTLSDKLVFITKLAAVSTIFTAIFGVGYQKGMILQMGIGNLNGSYELREIFNSAVLAYLFIFESVSNISIERLIQGALKSSIALIVLCFVIGTVLALVDSKSVTRVIKKSARYRREIRVLIKRAKSKILLVVFYQFISVFLGLFIAVASVIVAYSIILASSVFVTLPLLGYLAGAAKVNSIMFLSAHSYI